MRPDMAKLLTEGERVLSGAPSRKWGKRLAYDPDSEYEDQPQRASMSRHAHGNEKELTDVLSPLKGYLHKSVGRPWDEVYSEIARNLDRRSVSGIHVFSHLWQYVDLNCWIGTETGKVYSDSKHGPITPSDFYVHPWTGLLCEAPNRGRWRHRPEKLPVERTGIPLPSNPVHGLWGKSYQFIDGIWYYTEWTKEDRFAGYVALWNEIGRNPWRTKQELVILKKRQLGKKELRRFGLRNARMVPKVTAGKKVLDAVAY
jgi:hypothetical protein